MKTMKKITLLLLPLFLLSACNQDKKPETNQSQTEPEKHEALTEQAEKGDPHVRAQEYEYTTTDDRTDTIPPVKPETDKKEK